MSETETIKYLQDFHTLRCQNDLKGILDLCELLRRNKIHILGDILKNHIERVEEIQYVISGYYNHPTTLKMMFIHHGFPALRFQDNLIRFKNEDELHIKCVPLHSSLDKKYAVTDIKVYLKDFYFDPKPACPFTSERMTHRELAEMYYIRLMKINEYNAQEIVEFIDNYCEYYHGSKHHYDYYNKEAEKDGNRIQTILWFHEHVDKVYQMTKHDEIKVVRQRLTPCHKISVRSTIEKELKTFHCKSLYNKIHNEGKVMTSDVFHALAALDYHIGTETCYFNLMLSNERIKKTTKPEDYQHYFSSDGSSYDYAYHKEYFEKAYELFKEIKKIL
jgi:hypothetical protein